VGGLAAGLNRIAKVLDVLGILRDIGVMCFTSAVRRAADGRMSSEQFPLLGTPEVSWLSHGLK
jgi:hypothetical protein